MFKQAINCLRLFLLQNPQNELAVMLYQEGVSWRKLIARRKPDGTAGVTLDEKYIETIEIK